MPITMKKILFLGPPEAGKTSLRKFLFEGVPAVDLIENPEAPTIGLKYHSYEYVNATPTSKKDGKKPEQIPMTLSVVDSAGQNMNDWLSERADRVFNGCDVVILIFDVSDWLVDERRTYIEELIMYVYNVRYQYAPESRYYIVGHKFDKIPEGKTYREQMAKRIKRELNDFIFDKMLKYLDFDIFLTSLGEEYEQDTFLTLINLTTDLLS
nr:hypothetical protein [Candidatus Sigynarchaeota archaeon]